MRYIVNDACIGCGMCTNVCPDIFFMNDDGVAETVEEQDDEFLSDVIDAQDGCPVGAIEEA